MPIYQATASAPVNIACIKYWGKRDTKLILPTNSSLSVTLDQDHLRSTTTSRADPSFEKDRLWLNGVEEEIKDGGRLATCISEMKRMRREVERQDPSLPKLSSYGVHICSRNNFPTAAGLASSASGFAALVSSLAALYSLPASPSELSLIARQGSGSACRSLFGGFVAWEMGSKPDGSDSLAVEVAPREHWPDIHALICVVSDDKKGTSSTSGMQRTVETSTLLEHRIRHVVPARMKAISEAIRARDFDAFARITMQDSNQFHAVALDTDPPIFYMNDVSRAIIAIIVEYNRVSVANGGKLKAAYTFDAGPNAVIYAPKENLKEIIELIVHYFPQAEPFKDPFGLFGTVGVKDAIIDGFNAAVAKPFGVGAVKGLIHTRVGDGPRVLSEEEALLGANGLPK
ncbi:Diphosphomevalonate decarboxylase [Laetiporus sulphureus 93-53]|uniref:Diphosphomevalonate decarboxylase n=1 Tax=Laetiporus sulphureus 93-53 TaxID=1314785 RepID=A0A165GVI3_9APHY|nr:Diphosphomevalonate decarboxylase [Laetiporus sulphureus 93-53]KZT10878.1 Diphosphomevalonate decarboxylase [Laetiporus sulphureus 93-53]